METRASVRFLAFLAACAGWLGLVEFGAAGMTASGQSGGDKLRFDLYELSGRRVSSDDYAGVPVFLEFGACW